MKRFRDWSLSAKGVGLLLVASALPVATAALLTFEATRRRSVADAEALLGARADQLANEIDNFHGAYQNLVQRLATRSAVLDFLAAAPEERAGLNPTLEQLAATLADLDSNVSTMSVADAAGQVIFSTDTRAIGLDLAKHPTLRPLLSGETSLVIQLGNRRIADTTRPGRVRYVAAVHDRALHLLGAVLVSTRADALWDLVAASNGRAGPGSFAAMFDQHGVCIAHSYRTDHLFHPAGTLPEAEFNALSEQALFGPDTARLLTQVIPDEQGFQLARQARWSQSAEAVTQVHASATDADSSSVARRLKHTQWTIFLFVPASSFYSSAGALFWQVLASALVILAGALGLGVWLSRRIRSPFDELLRTVDAVARGDLSARAQITSGDELGHVAERFNAMSASIQASHEVLELCVDERTSQLTRVNQELETQREELLTHQAALEIQKSDLERADRMKSEFLANMSHELRTPLNSIIGFSELVANETSQQLSEQHQRYLAHVLSSGRHLLKLINDVLDLAKVEAGRLDLQLERVPIEEALTEACNLLTASARKRQVNLEQRGVTADEVEADRVMLRQVLLNLLSNAIKFTEEGSSIVISSERRGPALRVNVSDSGPGIAESLSLRIFQPFVQGERALVKQHQGTGLGLAISKRLVEAHGGGIGYEPRPGGGTNFWIELPCAPERATADPRASEPQAEELASSQVALQKPTDVTESATFELVENRLAAGEK